MGTIVDKILASTWYPDICKTPEDYKILAKRLHPDVCTDKNAIAAFAHLTALKQTFEKGFVFQDEAGIYRTNYLMHRWEGDLNLLKKSKANYDFMLRLAHNHFDTSSFEHFMKYVPTNLTFEDDVLVYRSQNRCIPMSKVISLLKEEERNKHLNWMYSRMLEFIVMLEALGFTHAGINPDSVFIVPETHAIKVTSFYHATIGDISSINGKYKNYYPAQLFTDKKGGSYVDIQLVKKCAICGLGDSSGSGVNLKANPLINLNVLTYLMTPESVALQSMQTWRSILDTNFIKEFITLNI